MYLIKRCNLQVFVFQRVDDVFLADLGHGIQHGDEHHQEHRQHRDAHAQPRQLVRRDDPLIQRLADEQGDEQGDRQAEEQSLQTVEDTLEIHHFVEAPGRHTHGFEHGKLPPAQIDVGGDGVEHIGHRNEGNQHDEAIG